MKKQANLFRFTRCISALLILVTLFSSCSSDDDSGDKTALRYFFRLESSDIVIVRIAYRNASGNLVEANETEVQIDGNIQEWSKIVNAEIPFDAKLELRVYNQSGGSADGIMALYKGEEVLDFEMLSTPNSMTFDAVLESTVSETD